MTGSGLHRADRTSVRSASRHLTGMGMRNDQTGFSDRDLDGLTETWC
jgi:hypothetical protein